MQGVSSMPKMEPKNIHANVLPDMRESFVKKVSLSHNRKQFPKITRFGLLNSNCVHGYLQQFVIILV